MSELIEKMAKETGADWFTIMYALEDRGVINSRQVQEIEDYFFNQEAVK